MAEQATKAKIFTLSDSAITIELGDDISPQTNACVHSLARAVEAAGIAGVVELVPSYRALAIYYDMLLCSQAELIAAVQPIIASLDAAQVQPGRLMRIPVLYGGEYGPDLAAVAAHCALEENDVIALHTAAEYPVYMLGFLPGFCYLGGMDKRIAAPRLKTPRVKIAAGSVGIAGEQTGIYPLASPGGWQIIGRTPVRLYDPARPCPALIEAGMIIKFYSINNAEYAAILAQQQKGIIWQG